jgi:hypothetical protein
MKATLKLDITIILFCININIMGAVYETLRHPWAIYYDFDRHRREQPVIYGRYKPSTLKRLQCWLLDEKITPVDWEEVPPYVDNYDRDGHLVLPREGKYHPFECVSQPDMISEANMYTRFAVFGIFWFWFYKYTLRNSLYARIPYIDFYLTHNLVMRMMMVGWFYMVLSRIYLNRNNKLPYN